jgi:phage replication-related protein YjqB (UPF0714/DUF867 family)
VKEKSWLVCGSYGRLEASFEQASLKSPGSVDKARCSLEKVPMADRFQNFNELADNAKVGIDFRVRIEDRGTPIVVLAPHGGWIEPVTSKIAECVAATEFSFYSFEALKKGPHGDFHITSHLFDEPKAVHLVGRSQSAVALHGRKNGGSETVWLGGRDKDLRDAIGSSLCEAGFDAKPNVELPGLDRLNICNRTLSSAGVQLELPRSLRNQLADDLDFLNAFCDAVRRPMLSFRT